jgi:hypothetical protein
MSTVAVSNAVGAVPVFQFDPRDQSPAEVAVHSIERVTVTLSLAGGAVLPFASLTLAWIV